MHRIAWMIPERHTNRNPIRVFTTLVGLLALLLAAGCAGRGGEPTAADDGGMDGDAVAAAVAVVPTWTNTPDASAAAVVVASLQEPVSTPASTSALTPALIVAGVPSPTPTIVANAQQYLAEAHTQLRYQDYDQVRAALAAVMENPASDQAALGEALFLQARVQSEEGLVTEALATTDQLLTSLADDEEALTDLLAKTRLLRGDMLSLSGKYSDAIAEYWLLLELVPEMAEAAQARIGRAYEALGDLDGAADAYRRAADAILPEANGLEHEGDLPVDEVVARVILLESLAHAYNGLARYGDAVAVYDEILDVAVQPPYRADVQNRAGQALAAAGNVPAAVERWLAATKEAPDSGHAYSALIELVNRDVAFDLYQRGVIDIAAGAWTPAINAFESYVDAASPTDERFAPALVGVGQSYAGLEDFGTALPYFQRVIDEYPACDCVGDAWLGKAQVEAALGDPVAARRTYRTFAREHPDHALAPEALWRSAFLALDGGYDVEAGFDFLTLADAFPESERSPAALYVVALGAFRQGLEAQAASTFARLQQNYPDYRWDATGYWLGRALQANDDPEAAGATWSALVERAPDIHYGLLASQALTGDLSTGGSVLDAIVVENPTVGLPGDDGSQAFAEAWLAEWVDDGIAIESSLPVTIAQDARLVAGQLLLDSGDRVGATAQLERLFRQVRSEPAALYPLLLEFDRLGVHRLAIAAATHLVQSGPASLVEDTPIFLQKMAYPRPFESLIVHEAQVNNLDPNLFFSLIRQESLFEEGARSSAAAQGLAQIIPDTGSWVATQLGYPNYTNDLVYRPDVNLKFGAYYLAWVRDYLDGNLISALVGYNAGPGNADQWRQELGADDALYAELLTYSEPRTYVRAILSNYYHYSRLYSE